MRLSRSSGVMSMTSISSALSITESGTVSFAGPGEHDELESVGHVVDPSPHHQQGVGHHVGQCRIAELAGAHGKRIGYEALAWAPHVNDHREAWALVRDVDHPALGLVLDSFHSLSRGIPSSSIGDIRADKLFLIQLADAPKLEMDLLNWSRHFRCMPGQGDFALADWKHVALYNATESRIEMHLQAVRDCTVRWRQGARAFAAGEDIHRATAAEIFGVDVKAVDNEQRRYAKVINFGLIYGMSAFGLARNLGMKRAEIREALAQFGTAVLRQNVDRLAEAEKRDAQRREAAIEVDPLALEDFGLPIKRQVVTELRDDDPGDEEFRGQPAGHDMLGGMRLRHGLRAAAAGVFRAARHQHPELSGDHVEPLGDVFPDLGHLAATAGAERAGRLDHALCAR